MKRQWCLAIQNRCCPVIHCEHTEQGHNSAGFSTGSSSLILKKGTIPFSIFVLFSSRFAPSTREAPQQRIFFEFFSVPGCPIEISNYAFETRVPRSHLVNGILDLLPEPAFSGCWWLRYLVVKSLKSFPPLQKKCQAGKLFWRQTRNSSRRWIFMLCLRNAEGGFLVRMSLVLKWNNLQPS